MAVDIRRSKTFYFIESYDVIILYHGSPLSQHSLGTTLQDLFSSIYVLCAQHAPSSMFWPMISHVRNRILYINYLLIWVTSRSNVWHHWRIFEFSILWDIVETRIRVANGSVAAVPVWTRTLPEKLVHIDRVHSGPAVTKENVQSNAINTLAFSQLDSVSVHTR